MTATASQVETLRDDVRVGDIFLDESYGRPPKESHVAELVERWDRSKVGAVYLSMRSDGTFAVIDGNHRVMACREVEGDDATLPARVYLDLSLDEEAALFSAFNGDRKALTSGDLFRADIVAGDRAALEINEVVESLGLHVAVNGAQASGGIQAIATLRNIHRRYGTNGLREVLLTLRNTMGVEQGAIQADIMKGLAGFAARYYSHPGFDKTRLYGILSTHSPAQFYGLANAIRSSAPTIDKATAVGMAMLQLYNHGLKRNGLPPWQRHAYWGEGLERQRENARNSTLIRKQGRNGNGAHE